MSTRGPRKPKPRHVKRAPAHHGIVIARTLEEPTGRARYYRGPGASSRVVLFSDQTFKVELWAIPPRGLARMPAGLAQRVTEALSKGLDHG